jgi:hypothetical protein
MTPIYKVALTLIISVKGGRFMYQKSVFVKLTALVLFIFILSSCGGNSSGQHTASNTEIQKYDLSILDRLDNVSYDSGIFCIPKGGSIYLYDTEFELINKIVKEGSQFPSVCTADNNIFAFDSRSSIVYVYMKQQSE